MPLQHKHSRSAGHSPNLIPGEVGVNLADYTLWLRADGDTVAIDLSKWRLQAVPAVGLEGAALRRTSTGVEFDPQTAPSSVVAGVIPTDPKPKGWSVPGSVMIGQQGDSLTNDNAVLIEPFYVSATSIGVASIGFTLTDAPTGAIRVGLASEEGTILMDHLFSDPAEGLNAVVFDPLTLETGAYYVLLWSEKAVRVQAMFGVRFEQGWAFTDGEPVFINHYNADDHDMSAGLTLPSITGADTDGAAGEVHYLLLRWN